jgi:DNA-binding transcriptional ArsR family regulator
MAEMLDDTWHSRDFPVLREIAKQVEEYIPGMAWPDIESVAEALDMDMTTVDKAAAALRRAGLIDGVMSSNRMGPITYTSVSPEARRLVGFWPSPETAADRLIAAIEAAIERTDDPVQKSRLRKIRDGFLGAGRDLTVSIGAAVITGQMT